MSFMNGSECSTSRNPLAQMAKHSTEDRSLQYDRVGSPGQVPGTAGLRSNMRTTSADDQQLLNNFQQGQSIGRASPFHMDQIRSELNGMGPMKQNDRSSSGWNNFRSASNPLVRQQQANNGPETARWAAEFHQVPLKHQAQSHNQHQSQQQQQQQPSYGSQIPRFTPQLVPMYQNANASAQYQQAPQQERIVELDDATWEKQFSAVELETKSKGKEREITDEDLGRTDTIDDFDEEAFDEDQFENVWNKLRDDVFNGLEDMDGPAWDRDFENFTASRPNYGDYQFEDEKQNPFTHEENAFQRGVELMDSGAKLSSAVLCFEAAVQKDPNHVEAWARLGAAQAQNEKEEPAIRALERCIQLDPGNLDALLYLSVSYVNEAYENAAYATLEKWLATKYPAVVDQARNAEPKLENEDRFQLHNRVTELFIRAAQLSPGGANMDADVQVGLGVLFYGNDEFEKAVDCFQAALQVRPNDPLLWNRLGATLANSNKSEEAIEAYHKALSLRPSFVRARFNLGVSCINIGCYQEAAQHLLSALWLHEVDGPTDELLANQSSNLYETLRRVLMAMERIDLMEKVGPDMDLNEFRQYFEF